MSEASYLYIQAGRCFRLARGPASPLLADELEALGRAFEEEAKEVEVTAAGVRGRFTPGMVVFCTLARGRVQKRPAFASRQGRGQIQ